MFMSDRQHAFGHQSYNHLDNLIFWLRKRQVLRHLTTHSGVIADLGSGYDCRLLIALLDKNPNLQAIAVDSEFSSNLPSSRLTTIVTDLNRKLPISSHSIDTVLSLAVLEHLEKPAVLLQEIHRTLRPGGKLILTTPGPRAQPLLEFLAYRLHVIDEHEIRDHKQYFSSKELMEVLVSAGFSRKLITTKTFIFGMNNLVIATR